ncbi:hypothetical protein UNPF46_34570 [Bradyrhizobium sp. UNPF46]|uniref:hypothetical protein n=1 Tax=Bradyrhizobium sp. UNPF46 TaxID=1141168 RepID=UPI00114EE343|nr:hypothetical protein [Bradyrhizobium sp. UNPF46]TQF26280.1 hypothetical protein UNPF46_34570 [Bradyrhizobium sp. UNPF46]
MKVQMDIRDGSLRLGIFKTIPVKQVIIAVEFSEEEKAAITKLGLADHIFYSHPINSRDTDGLRIQEDTHYHIKVGRLLKPLGGTMIPSYDSQAEAQQAIQELTEQFKLLKQKLKAADAPTSTTLDL